MRRVLIALVCGLVAGGFAGFASGIFVYPFWFLTDVASEMLDARVARTATASGTFTRPDPNDPIHWGKGGVTLYTEADGHAIVFLAEDFEVGPGPRFHVYLVAEADVAGRRDFLESEKVDLGRLRNFSGSQIYDVPAGVDPASYRSVVIWCKEFGVLISPARLSFAAMTS